MKTRQDFASILAAYKTGQTVFWKNEGYRLTGPSDNPEVTFTGNGHCVGLFWADGNRSSYDPSEFIVANPETVTP